MLVDPILVYLKLFDTVMFPGKVAVPFGVEVKPERRMEKEELKIVNKGMEDEMVSSA